MDLSPILHKVVKNENVINTLDDKGFIINDNIQQETEVLEKVDKVNKNNTEKKDEVKKGFLGSILDKLGL